jgi:HEAT repeat protein
VILKRLAVLALLGIAATAFFVLVLGQDSRASVRPASGPHAPAPRQGGASLAPAPLAAVKPSEKLAPTPKTLAPVDARRAEPVAAALARTAAAVTSGALPARRLAGTSAVAPRAESRQNARTPEEAAANRRLGMSVLSGLRDGDAEARIAALRIARDEEVPGVQGEVARVALEDPDVSVRRFAVQTLALDGHCEEHHDLFVSLLASTDWKIRANATMGLARSGDETAQSDLLALMERLRAEASPHADAIARAVASPDLCGGRILDYYRARSNDRFVSSDERRDAARILEAKEAALAAR